MCAMAETYKRPVAMHDCTGPFTLYAGIHLAINATNAIYQESVRAYLRVNYPDLVTELPAIETGAHPRTDETGTGYGAPVRCSKASGRGGARVSVSAARQAAPTSRCRPAGGTYFSADCNSFRNRSTSSAVLYPWMATRSRPAWLMTMDVRRVEASVDLFRLRVSEREDPRDVVRLIRRQHFDRRASSPPRSNATRAAVWPRRCSPRQRRECTPARRGSHTPRGSSACPR